MTNRELMIKVLQGKFVPHYLSVIDESHLHAGHNDDAKSGGTHFKALIVSDAFEGKKTLERHRMVYEALKANNVNYHALAIAAKTVKEYDLLSS